MVRPAAGRYPFGVIFVAFIGAVVLLFARKIRSSPGVRIGAAY
jgi:hypothetical protein